MRPKNRVRTNRLSRHRRIRRVIHGTAERPRLCLFRSLKHLEAQLVDDVKVRTVVSSSTRDVDFRKSHKGMVACGNIAAAKALGAHLAAKAKTNGILKVVFDRAGYLYHGRVRAFAEAARGEGLEF